MKNQIRERIKEIVKGVDTGYRRLMYMFYCECLIDRLYNYDSDIDLFEQRGDGVIILNTKGETIEFSPTQGLKIHSLIGDATIPFPSLVKGKEFDWNSSWFIFCDILNGYFPKRHDRF